jgi:tetratricopeptide (TPR) repeat protein
LRAIDELLRMHLLRETEVNDRRFIGDAYRFTHDKIREVVYLEAGTARRRIFHRRALDALEAAPSAQRARHALAAGLDEPAVRLSLAAGDDAMRLLAGRDAIAHYDRAIDIAERLCWRDALVDLHARRGKALVSVALWREAITSFERALDALDHLPESHQNLERSIDVRLDMRAAFTPLNDILGGLDRLREAGEIAERLSDRRRLGIIAAFQAFYHWQLAEHTAAIAAGERAIAMEERLGDIRLGVTARYQMSRSFADRGDHRRAIDYQRWNVAHLTGDMTGERFGMATIPAISSRAMLAYSLAELGEFDEAGRWGDEALHMAEREGHYWTLCNVCWELGRCYLLRGDLAAAIAVLELGFERSRVLEVQPPTWLLGPVLGRAYMLAARNAEGLALLEDVVPRHLDGVRKVRLSLWTAWLGEAYLEVSRDEDALTLGERSIWFAREYGQRGYEAWALRLRAEIAARREPSDANEAASRYHHALALAEELGMRPLQAHCHLGLGSLYQCLGRPAEARDKLATAATMLRDMGMTFWLPKAQGDVGTATG